MTAALEGGEWSAARPGHTLPRGNTQYPLYRRLGGPQGWSGQAENLIPMGIRSRTVQPIVSRYTDWATRLYICIYIYVHVWLTACVSLQHLHIAKCQYVILLHNCPKRGCEDCLCSRLLWYVNLGNVLSLNFNIMKYEIWVPIFVSKKTNWCFPYRNQQVWHHQPYLSTLKR